MPKLVDHDQRREEVAEAAWRVIGRDGLEGATLREIAREAGFTTGVIQHYFRDRDELLAFAASLISEQSAQRLQVAIADHPVGRARLTALLEVLVPANLRAARVAVLLGFWARAATDPRHNGIYLKQYARRAPSSAPRSVRRSRPVCSPARPTSTMPPIIASPLVTACACAPVSIPNGIPNHAAAI